MLLCEDAKQEVGISVRLEGGGNDEVLPWRQLEMAAHLPGGSEDLREAMVLMLHEEVLLQVDILEVLQLYVVSSRWVQGWPGKARGERHPTLAKVKPGWAGLGGGISTI